MPALPSGPLGKAELTQIAGHLGERVRRAVSIEVWTREESGLVTGDRDTGAHAADALALCRQLAGLHPALSITAYDLDRHADRAQRAGIDLSPTIVLRSGGRSVVLSGMFYGPLFAPFLDAIVFLSVGTTPVKAETRQALAALEGDVRIEAFVTPFDPFSERMAPLLLAFAAESKRVKLRMVEASQFPVLAGQRLLTEVPVLVMNDKRIAGYWEEDGLVEQVSRIAAANDAPVIRERVLVAEYVSEDEARSIAQEQQAAQAAQPQTTSSGLIIPGQE